MSAYGRLDEEVFADWSYYKPVAETKKCVEEEIVDEQSIPEVLNEEIILAEEVENEVNENSSCVIAYWFLLTVNVHNNMLTLTCQLISLWSLLRELHLRVWFSYYLFLYFQAVK